MARTAPVPNMVAIPGMNPGLFVLGGGGDGGGGGAGGGDGSGGKQGAGGKNGGKDANGGGKGAAGCGAGGNNGCPGGHDGGGVTKGDPVDVATGRVLTVPVIDARFSGPLGLELARSYSSAARERDVGLGFGWSHSFGWYVEARRRSVHVWQEGGQRVVFDRPEPGQEVVGPMGWSLRAETWGFVVEADDDLRRTFAEQAGDRALLSSVEDRRGRRTTLRYDGGRLVEIVDPAGRSLRLHATAEGRIERIDAKNAESQGRTVTFARYAYDDAGRLVRVTDVRGGDTSFAYDDDNRLTSFTSPLGLTFHFVYDAEGRCVETWGDRAGRADPSLAPDASPVLADGRTKAKGLLHNVIDHASDGYCEVVDATRVQRFFFDEAGRITKASSGPSVLSRAYDALGLLVAYTDPAGNTSTWRRDARGRIVAYTDAAGHTWEYERDDQGNVTRSTNPEGGVVTVAYDARGNPIRVTDPAGHTTHYGHDDRGLLTSIVWPNGGAMRIARDHHGNIAEVVAPDGGTYRLTHDHFGRQTSITGPTGAATTMSYDDAGDLVRAVSATGAITSYRYDAEGHPVAFTLPGGRTYEIGWAGVDQSISLTRPDRTGLRLFYDSDQKLAIVRNEIGEEHRYFYDAAGFLERERTYDGRTLSYAFDLAGHLVGYDNGAGEWSELTCDALGRIVARKRPDDTEDAFAYDGRGQLVRAANDRVEVLFERDAFGHVRRETQIVDGASHTVDVAYDALGRRIQRATSLGSVERIERDVLGSVARWSLDGDEAILTRDALGREVARSLRSGGRLETAFDADGRLVRRRSVGSGGSASVPAGQPAWLGPPPGDVRMDRSYGWSPEGDLERIWDQTDGFTQLGHDALGRVLAVAHPRLREELFRYDAADRLYETGAGAPARAYAAGGRLEQRGDLRHTWDAAGRLIRREALGPTGAVAETWRFAWDAADRLQSIVKPDGTTLDFVYDALGRRVSKTVRAPAPASGGAGPVRASTRFVWDRDTIAHEIRTAAADSGDPVIEERTYAWVEETYVPFAHRDVRIVGGVREDLGTVHYANDPIGTPAHLLGPDGAVVGRVVRTAWGARSEEGGRATPLRFQGQYEDEETGLYYNRHRYYDPETGTYLSADPIGLAGGQLPFGYVTNPFVVVDPTGLGGGNTTITLNDGTEIDGTSNSGNPPHPAIAAAIPDLPDGTKPPTPKGTKGQCAEVDALSKLLDREKVPRDGTATKEQVDNAMKKIKTVETTDKETGAPKKACGFCGRMMSNLGIPKSKIVNG